MFFEQNIEGRVAGEAMFKRLGDYTWMKGYRDGPFIDATLRKGADRVPLFGYADARADKVWWGISDPSHSTYAAGHRLEPAAVYQLSIAMNDFISQSAVPAIQIRYPDRTQGLVAFMNLNPVWITRDDFMSQIAFRIPQLAIKGEQALEESFAKILELRDLVDAPLPVEYLKDLKSEASFRLGIESTLEGAVTKFDVVTRIAELQDYDKMAQFFLYMDAKARNSRDEMEKERYARLSRTWGSIGDREDLTVKLMFVAGDAMNALRKTA